MSLLDGLRKGRGRQLSGSGAAPRRRLSSRRSNPRLSADRIAAALGTLPIAPSVEVRSQRAVRVESRASGVVRAPQVRMRGGAPDQPTPVVLPPVVPPRVVARSAASVPLAADGRHRGAAEQLAVFPPPPASAATPPRHGRVPGNGPGETGRVGSAHRKPPRPPEGGRHRRSGPPKRVIAILPAALLAVGAKSHRLVVLGVVVLLVAVALVFGVRVALARPSAQPDLVATTAQGQLGGEVRPPSPSGVL